MIEPKLRKDGRWYCSLYIGSHITDFHVYGNTKEDCKKKAIEFLYYKENDNLLEYYKKYNIKSKHAIKLIGNVKKDFIDSMFIDEYTNFLDERFHSGWIKINTKNDYIGSIKLNIPSIANARISELTSDLIKNDFLELQRKKGDKLMVKTSIKIHPFLEKLRKKRIIPYNFLEDIPFPKLKKNKFAKCDEETLNRLLTILKHDETYGYLYFIIFVQSFTGTRISETLALDRYKSLNTDENYIEVFQQQTKETGKGYFITNQLKTPKSDRRIYLFKEVIEEILLCYYRQEEYFKLYKINKKQKYETLLILNSKGDMVKENTAHRHWGEFIKLHKEELQLTDKITFHSFRRHFSEWLREKGIDQKVIKEFMGHASEEQTEDYQFIDYNYAKSELEKINNLY